MLLFSSDDFFKINLFMPDLGPNCTKCYQPTTMADKELVMVHLELNPGKRFEFDLSFNFGKSPSSKKGVLDNP